MRDQFFCGRLPFKKQSDSCFILQTSPDILARHVQTVCLVLSDELFYSAGLKNFSYQMSVEVSLVTMPPKGTIKSVFKAASKRSCRHIEMKLQIMKGELRGGGGDKNGMSNFIFRPSPPPTFYFALPPLRRLFRENRRSIFLPCAHSIALLKRNLA